MNECHIWQPWQPLWVRGCQAHGWGLWLLPLAGLGQAPGELRSKELSLCNVLLLFIQK